MTNSNLTLIKAVNSPKSKVLFLGYTAEKTSLIFDIVKLGYEVWHTSERIISTKGFDLVISFGYKHILSKELLLNTDAPIINLHISYLPWNRGAHPNFWSFYDGTPSGVTIHLVDEGIDTGPIIYQKKVNFDKFNTTFAETYNILITEIENLFRKNINTLLERKFKTKEQSKNGTYHCTNQLPKKFKGWHENINSEIIRLKNSE
jgi:methionyl-tRNA formyltransferase